MPSFMCRYSKETVSLSARSLFIFPMIINGKRTRTSIIFDRYKIIGPARFLIRVGD
jgi:hypothetical protein